MNHQLKQQENCNTMQMKLDVIRDPTRDGWIKESVKQK